MEIADDGHGNAELRAGVDDLGNGGGGGFGVDRDANELRAGAGERHHLIDRGSDVGGIGVGHRLNDDRMIAARLAESGAANGTVVTATRGNFGQAIAYAARREGMEAVVYVRHGNSPSKNRAMQALGARLVVHGQDFEEARQEAARVADVEGHHY